MTEPDAYPRYTAQVRKLTNEGCLASHVAARTREARTLLAQLPTLPEDEQWRLMHQFVWRFMSGNSEAERVFRLINRAEPYSS